MTDPYKTAFNVQNGIAIEQGGIEEMAAELQRLKQDYRDQNIKLIGFKQDLSQAFWEVSQLEEQTGLHTFKGARKAYEAVLNQMNYLGI